MEKAKIYGALKILFRLAGFPLMLTIMLITLAPMFGADVMGDYARNWILIFFAIWAAVELIGFILNKYLGNRSKKLHNIMLIIIAAISVLAVLLPTTIGNAVLKNHYDKDAAALSDGVSVASYDSVAGWHRDFTSRKENEVYALINDHYDFMKMYGLSGTESEWYSNADKENKLGYKYGSFDMAQKLVTDKRAAAKSLAKAKAELETVEATHAENVTALAEAEDAYANNNSPANKALLDAAQAAFDASQADMVRLKGLRVDISAYKEAIVDVILQVINDASQDLSTVFPDGIGFEIIGIDLGDLQSYIEVILGMVPGIVNKDMLMGLIPDVIYTGAGEETVNKYQTMVDGSASDLSLVAAEQINFRINHNPQALATGAVNYAAFMCAGLIVLSVFLADYFKKKEKGAKNNADEEVYYA